MLPAIRIATTGGTDSKLLTKFFVSVSHWSPEATETRNWPGFFFFKKLMYVSGGCLLGTLMSFPENHRHTAQLKQYFVEPKGA